MNRIVVGVDPSASGRAALRWALREAVRRQVPVHALRAWLVPSYGMYYPAGSSMAVVDPDAADQAQLIAETELKLAREQVPGADRLEAHAVAVTGPAAQVLVDASRDAGTVVVGLRGVGALSRAVLGSVSSSVLHHATCPVVVVPDDHDGGATVRRVLVGVDHSEGSLAALRLAVEQARAHDAVLVPVCVHEVVWAPPDSGVDVVGLEHNEGHALRSAAAAAGAAGLSVEPEVVVGHPAATLLRLAQPGDLLVVGSRGRGGFSALLLGSTSTQCTQHAPCPVVVVRATA